MTLFSMVYLIFLGILGAASVVTRVRSRFRTSAVLSIITSVVAAAPLISYAKSDILFMFSMNLMITVFFLLYTMECLNDYKMKQLREKRIAKYGDKPLDPSPVREYLDRQTVNAICNMFRSLSHTVGYDPGTPLGEIARVARSNWFFRTSEHPYPEWHNYYETKPTEADATERGEILVQSVQGDFNVCDYNHTIQREDGSIELFNGDVYIKPLYWCRIIEPVK